jgi:hypothetical protein
MLGIAGKDASNMTLRYFNPSLLQRLLLAMLAAMLLYIGSLYDWAVFSLSNVPEPESFDSLDDWKEFVLSNASDYFTISWYELYLPGPLIALLLLAPLAVADRRWLRFGVLLVVGTGLIPVLLWVDLESPVDLDAMQSWLFVPILPIICALCAGVAVSLVGGVKTNRLFWPVVAGAGVLGGLLMKYGNSACVALPFSGTRCSPWPPFIGTMAYLCFLSAAFHVGSDAERNEGGNYASRATQ